MEQRVLLVDDSSVMRGMIKRVFEACNLAEWEFSEASDGVEGLQILQNNLFDLILLDVHMPRMNGLEFLEKARAISGLEQVPVIVITSECSTQQLDQIKAHQASIIQKPFTPEILQENIRQILQSTKSA